MATEEFQLSLTKDEIRHILLAFSVGMNIITEHSGENHPGYYKGMDKLLNVAIQAGLAEVEPGEEGEVLESFELTMQTDNLMKDFYENTKYEILLEEVIDKVLENRMHKSLAEIQNTKEYFSESAKLMQYYDQLLQDDPELLVKTLASATAPNG